MSSVYMSIDFETINQTGDWWAYGCMVANYPAGEILLSMESYCQRNEEDFDAPTLSFWKNNEVAFHRLQQLSLACEEEREEMKLCQFIQKVLNAYPEVQVLSDNPQFDLRLLDNILLKHNFPVIGLRRQSYQPSICTLSYKNGVKSILGRKRFDDIQCLTTRSVNQFSGVPHCPLFDCAVIISNHFNVVDVARGFNVTNPFAIWKPGGVNCYNSGSPAWFVIKSAKSN